MQDTGYHVQLNIYTYINERLHTCMYAALSDKCHALIIKTSIPLLNKIPVRSSESILVYLGLPC